VKVGSVFDQTSTTDFLTMLDPQIDGERLLYSYVEVSPEGSQPNPDGERIVARIRRVCKQNPLLSQDQAGVSASIDIGGLGFDFSRRFTYGWAECTVVGTLSRGGLDMNRRPITPNAEVHTPSQNTLRQLFYRPGPSYVPLGTIDTFGQQDGDGVPVTLDADQLVTKHFCIFGMTGSGKTNTAAKLLEELMARGHRMVVFDSHDDYVNLEDYENLFRATDSEGNVRISAPVIHGRAVREALMRLPNATVTGTKSLEESVYERILREASVVYNNKPARQFLREGDRCITRELVEQLVGTNPWRTWLEKPQVANRSAFPELKYYGTDFADLTIGLFEAFLGEEFSSAQTRCLRGCINQSGVGAAYLSNVKTAVDNSPARQETKDALDAMLTGLQRVYNDAVASGNQASDLENMCRAVVDRRANTNQTVFRLSLSNLSNPLRKATVYGVVTYIFRSFKKGTYRATTKDGQPPNAYPALFVLEEARSLIPRSSGIDDTDVSGAKARRAMRELAYEGRKFSLGFGLVSQKPSTVDPEVVSQSNTFILHQLMSPDDQQYVRDVTEGMSLDELELVKSLGKGKAIVTGVGVQSTALLQVYFRYSKEGIEEPTPIQDSLSSIELIRHQLKIT